MIHFQDDEELVKEWNTYFEKELNGEYFNSLRKFNDFLYKKYKQLKSQNKELLDCLINVYKGLRLCNLCCVLNPDIKKLIEKHTNKPIEEVL
jgi:hypothetical protein